MGMMRRLHNARPYLTAVFDGTLSILLALTCVVLLYKMLTPAPATPAPKPVTFATGDRVPAVNGAAARLAHGGVETRCVGRLSRTDGSAQF